MKDNIINFDNKKGREEDLFDEMAKMMTNLIRLPITQMAHEIEDKNLREVSVDFIKSIESVEKILKDIDNIEVNEKDKKDFVAVIGLYNIVLGNLVHPIIKADVDKRGRF